METSDRQTIARLTKVAVMCAALVALIGGGHLFAWLGGFMAQRGFAAITMKTNAALCMLLSGISLLLLIPEEIGRGRLWAARICAATVLLLATLTLSQHLVGWDLGIDQLLAREPLGAMGVIYPNRMGPPASLIYTLAGLSLLILSHRGGRGLKLSQGLALGACLIALLGTLGHLYGIQKLYALEQLTAISWRTAASLLLLGIGMLCARPDRGLMAPVTAADPGGQIIRRLLIPAFFCPVGLGWLRLFAERRGLYATEMGTALFTLSFIIIFSLLVYNSGHLLSRSSVAEKAANNALRASEERLHLALNAARMGVWELILGDKSATRTLEHDRIFGYEFLLPEWTYEKFLDHVVAEDRPEVDRKFGAAVAGGMDWHFECRIQRVDGAIRWIEAQGRSYPGEGNIRARMVGLVADITERKRTEQEIRQLNAMLERRVQERTAELTAANQELEAFTYTVSHDLRAPLRHITGFVELLVADAGPVLNEEGRRYIGIISDAARRMGTLIDDLLTFSRIERAPIAPTTVDLGHLVIEARRELEPETAGREIDWVIEPLPQVSGDPTLLRTVMINLLANAIKYTRQRTPARIEVGSTEEDGMVVCFVRDNGAGFDMRFADKLFGVFQRLHPAQQFEGTGIGLASVRRIIQRHGGRTWGEGEVDKGATFYFSLPSLKM